MYSPPRANKAVTVIPTIPWLAARSTSAPRRSIMQSKIPPLRINMSNTYDPVLCDRYASAFELIDSLDCGKAPGSDGIPPEVVKAGKHTTLPDHLFELLLQCWEEGSVLQDMCDANIIRLYKNKGERSDCNNYRGISLLGIVGKTFARIVLSRLQTLAERVYPEAQCGFRAK